DYLCHCRLADAPSIIGCDNKSRSAARRATPESRHYRRLNEVSVDRSCRPETIQQFLQVRAVARPRRYAAIVNVVDRWLVRYQLDALVPNCRSFPFGKQLGWRYKFTARVPIHCIVAP